MNANQALEQLCRAVYTLFEQTEENDLEDDEYRGVVNGLCMGIALVSETLEDGHEYSLFDLVERGGEIVKLWAAGKVVKNEPKTVLGLLAERQGGWHGRN